MEIFVEKVSFIGYNIIIVSCETIFKRYMLSVGEIL
jgi:hypothetical protein